MRFEIALTHRSVISSLSPRILLPQVIVKDLCTHRRLIYSERDRSPVKSSLVTHSTCPNTLVPLAAGTCLSEKRISLKYEETVADRNLTVRVTQVVFHNA